MFSGQNEVYGGRRLAIVLLAALGSVAALGISGLLAQGQDSTKPGLREGVFVPVDTVKKTPSPVAVEGLRRLNENSPQPWNLYWDEFTGLPRSLYGSTSRSYGSNPTEAALAFVSEYKAMLTGLTDSQFVADYWLRVGGTKELRLEIVVTVDVCYKGVKIHDGMFGVYVRRDGTIWMVNNSFRPVQLADVTPTLTPADAEEIVRQLAAPDTVEPVDGKMELVIYLSSPPRLAYFGFRKVNGWTWGFFLDATTGEAIRIGRLGHVDGKRPVRFGGDARQLDITPDSITRRPLPMLPAEPVRRLPDPEKRGLQNDSGSSRPGTNIGQFEGPARLRPPKGDSRPADPNQDCWFFGVNFLPGPDDGDFDGYIESAMVEWDADTWGDDTERVTVRCYGIVIPQVEQLLFEFGPYYITGSEPDWWSAEFRVPSRGDWWLTVVLFNEQEIPMDERDLGMCRMESTFEDLAYAINNVNVREGPDIDGDGLPRADTLTLVIWVEPYDTTVDAPMILQLYVRNEAGSELYLYDSPSFSQSPGSEVWWYLVTAADRHGLWDFRLDLVNQWGQVAYQFPYGRDQDIMDVPLERPIEDPPVSAIFDPNPVVMLHDLPFVDVDTLRDRGDSVYSAMLLALTTVSLQGIAPPGSGFYWLTGPYVEVVEFLGLPNAPIAAAPEADGPNFPYYRSEKQFEQVMCYFHIDRCQRYIQSLGFSDACNRPIVVDAHGCGDGDSSAYRSPVTGDGDIVFGDGGVDDAEDADVILHEYGHAVQDNQAPVIYSLGQGSQGYGNETYYMVEGFAYYWVASSTDSISSEHDFPSSWCDEWNARGFTPPAACMYIVENDKVYPSAIVDTADHYGNSEIWAGSLWDIFQQYGKRITDSLVLRSHELIVPNPTFHDGAEKILVADVQGYQGTHAAGIRQIFEDRGILESCDCGSTTTLKLWADCNCDGAINAVDVVRMVNYVFKSQLGQLVNCPGVVYPNIPPPGPNPDPTCPRRLGDANWDGFVNPVDVVRYTNFVYKSQLAQICNNPCLSPDCN